MIPVFERAKAVHYKGMVRSDMPKPALISFFTARVHATKSTVKILAANTHCKYFLKIAEFTYFFLYAEPLLSEVCTTLPSAHNSSVISRLVQHTPRLSQPCCVLLCPAPALLGVDISPMVWQVTILAMFSPSKLNKKPLTAIEEDIQTARSLTHKDLCCKYKTNINVGDVVCGLY
jgi:hypothetical protein